MARIVYKQGCEPLSGIYCGVQFISRANGNSSMFVHLPSTPGQVKKSPAARKEFIIKSCVSDIQKQMPDMREAMRRYKNIKQCVQRLYKNLCTKEKSTTKLRKKILEAYYQKCASDTSHYRAIIDPLSIHSQENC